MRSTGRKESLVEPKSRITVNVTFTRDESMALINITDADAKFKNHEALTTLQFVQGLEQQFNTHMERHALLSISTSPMMGETFCINAMYAPDQIGNAGELAAVEFQKMLTEAGWPLRVKYDRQRSRTDIYLNVVFCFTIFRDPK